MSPERADDLRIGDRERDEVMSALREHFAQGRITREEFDDRLEATLTARTAKDLRAVTADLPDPYDTAAPLPRHDARRHRRRPSWYGPRGGDTEDGRGYGWAPRSPGSAPRGESGVGPVYGPGPGNWPDFRPGGGHFGHLFGPGHPAVRHYRYRRSRPRGGRPRVLFLILAVLILASLAGGTAAPLLFMVKVVFLAWIAFAVIGLIHHRRDHHHRTRH